MQSLRNLDLRLLQVFDCVFRHCQISRAAEELGLTQSAVSQAIGRMRQHFGDPLFVRVGAGMEPTPAAGQLHALATNSIAQLETLLAFRPSFEPRQDARSFHIGMTDVGQVVVLPRLLDAVAKTAPNAQVAVSQIGAESADLLERGLLDLTLGFLPDAQGRVVQQALFPETFACLVRRGHPRIGAHLSLRQYRQEQHVVVRTPGTGHSVMERSLARKGIVRRAAVEVPNFIGLAMVVASTDLVATLPRRAAELLSRGADVQVMDLPVAVPSYQVRQQWHERMQRDPGHLWLRALIASLFSDQKRL